MSSSGDSTSAVDYVARKYEKKNKSNLLGTSILSKLKKFQNSNPRSQSPSSDSVNSLLKELTFIVATRKSDQYGASVSILDKYTADTVPTHLLRSENYLIRRLTAVLLAFVFQNKNEVLAIKSQDPRENVCMLQNFLFLNPYKSAMKNFSPKPYEYVSKPIFYYLPNSQFPNGLPSFLDIEKMYSILVTKEYLRIPDPSEMVIWLPLDIEFEGGTAHYENPRLHHMRSLSLSEEDYSPSQANISTDGDKPHHLRSRRSRMSIDKELGPPQPTVKSKGRSNRATKNELPDFDSGAVPHRVKCFQFFKKVCHDRQTEPDVQNLQIVEQSKAPPV